MTGKKKLLFLEYFPFMGGGQAVLLSVIKFMKKYYEVEALIFNRGLIEAELKKLGVKTHYIQAPRNVKYRYITKSIPFHLRVADFLRRGNYSLVYSGGMTAVKLAGPSCLRLGIPLIWHKQVIIEKGYFSYNAGQARLLSGFASKIICVSNASKESMIRSGVKPSKISVVHNGIDIPGRLVMKRRDRIRKKYSVGKSFVCGTVCIFRKNKGLEILLETAAIIQKKKLPVKFMLAGRADKGEEWYEEKIRKEARDKGLDNFIFTGYGDKYAFMPAFDLYVMPSPNEPFGLVTIEAMALGIPAAGFNSGGTGEIITDGVDGMLARGMGAGALAEKIEEACRNRGMVKRAGKNALKTAGEKFSLGRQMLEIGKVMEETLRLSGKNAGKYEETQMYERFMLESKAGYPGNPMFQYSKGGIRAHVESMNKYTSLEVKRSIKTGYMPTGYSVFIKPLLYFMKHYFVKAGFLDGFAGLVYHSINAMYIFTMEIKIMEAAGISGFKLLTTLHKRAR